MCTVTYLPMRRGFVLTHNRDEAPARHAAGLTEEVLGGTPCLFPRDPAAGGTFFLASADGRTACILNGAFEKHLRQPPYRQSRGLILTHWKSSGLPDADFVDTYPLDNIEPFTLLLFGCHSALECRWDGHQKHVRTLDAAQPHFWCSATLYDAHWQRRREEVFRAWLASRQRITAAGAWCLHRTGNLHDPAYNYVMNRHNVVRTVSITQARTGGPSVRVQYLELLGMDLQQRSLPA